MVSVALLLLVGAQALASELEAPPGAAGISLEYVQAGELRMRVASAGEGPLLVLLHGFPESWYSWRHQLRALADAGYRAAAPDMRGFGRTEAPQEIDAYDVIDLCGDVTGLIDALDEERAILVGHDWGAVVAWYCALLEPERFSALITMSVPWRPRSDRSALTWLRESYGENFFYMLYFQEPGVAEAELDPDPRALLERFLSSPGIPREPPTITDPKASAGGLLGRIGLPEERAPWLSAGDLDYYVAELTRTGFRGGLNYYRNLGRNWELTPRLKGAEIRIPTLFLAGERDVVLAGRTREQIEPPMRAVAPDLRGVHLLPGAGHWIQQERADEVNALMVGFLQGVVPATTQRDFGRLHPQAPPETEQYAFLIGEWSCTTRFQKPDGSGEFNEGHATWTGEYILDGWAIQDLWVRRLADGREFHGTNIRSFNPETKKWDNRWLPAGSLQWVYYESEMQADTMVMTGGEGSDPFGDYVDRNTFSEITPEHWRWRKDRSYDGGKTWREGIGYIEATRSD